MKCLLHIALVLMAVVMAPRLSLASSGRSTHGDLRIAPTLGLSYGYLRQEARLLQTEGSADREVRTQANTRFDIGLGYDYLQLANSLRLRGTSSAGVGMLYFPGDLLLHLRQDTAVQWVPRHWFTGSVGLGASIDCNPSRPAFSSVGIAIPLGIRLGLVELEYRPMFHLPLGRDEQMVLGGSLRKRRAPGVAWLDFVVRVRLPFARLN